MQKRWAPILYYEINQKWKLLIFHEPSTRGIPIQGELYPFLPSSKWRNFIWKTICDYQKETSLKVEECQVKNKKREKSQ